MVVVVVVIVVVVVVVVVVEEVVMVVVVFEAVEYRTAEGPNCQYRNLLVKMSARSLSLLSKTRKIQAMYLKRSTEER